MSKNAEALANLIRARAGDPRVRHLAGRWKLWPFPVLELPGFPQTGVSRHNPKPVIDGLEGVRVALVGGPAAISAVSNLVADLPVENIRHDHAKALAPLAAAKLEKTLRGMASQSA